MIQVPLDNLQKTRQYLAEHILRVVQAVLHRRKINSNH